MSTHKSLKGNQDFGTPEHRTGLFNAQKRKKDRIREEENELTTSILSNERSRAEEWAEHISRSPSFIRRALLYELFRNLPPAIETVQERQKRFLTETLPQFLSQEMSAGSEQAKSTLEEALANLSISSLNDIISIGCKDLGIAEEILLYMHLWEKRDIEKNALKNREKRRQAWERTAARALQGLSTQARGLSQTTSPEEHETEPGLHDIEYILDAGDYSAQKRRLQTVLSFDRDGSQEQHIIETLLKQPIGVQLDFYDFVLTQLPNTGERYRQRFLQSRR